MTAIESPISVTLAGGKISSQREFLMELLAAPGCPQYTMNIDQLDGYLRAIAIELTSTTPEEWMPLIFGGEFPCPIAIEGYETDVITNALICFYNSYRAQVLSNECELFFPCEYSEDRPSRIQAEQWARGFMQGYIFWQDIWGRLLDERQTHSNPAVILPIPTNDDLDDILTTISAVADANYAMQTGVTVEELAVMFNGLPQKVIEYGRLAHIMRSNS